MDDKQKEQERPPQNGEEIISDVARVRWLVTRYLKRPAVAIRARDEKFDDLLCDPDGYVWGFVTPLVEPGEQPRPYLKRCVSYLVGADNLEVKQPII
jgi:hypothetical protein